MEKWQETVKNDILPKVIKPLRYVGNEYNVVKKEWDSVKLRTVFAFPDIYEIGMSHLGMRILYHLTNDQPEYLMERVFAPWVDMEEELRSRNIPLFSLESYRPIADFDCVAFTLQYEMSYTNILNILALSGIPLLAAERGNEYPLVIAGGPCAYNPEPLADFLDLVVLGEGEEVILELFAVMAEHRAKRDGKQDKAVLLKELAKIDGVYVPEFYEPVYDEQGKLLQTKVREPGVSPHIVKRVVKDIDNAYFPLQPIVPYLEVVHDRIMLEVLRGCTRGCRFCQAGMLYRPVRERSAEVLKKQAEKLLETTGYDEISLTSLSTSDYCCVNPLITGLLDKYSEDKVGVSLPSLRVDSFSLQLAQQVQRVRKSGLTFAPEAGTQRLRDVINKGVTEENLMEVTKAAFAAGWSQIKLYFMLGLPTETNEDLDGIADLAYRVLENGSKIMKEQGRHQRPKITVSVSTFVPKAHTPFQWEAQDTLEIIEEKQQYLRSKIKDRRISYNYHEGNLSFLEAVFAKGDRRLGPALFRAWQKGCKFDSWSEHFKFQTWLEVFAEIGIDVRAIANKPLEYEDALPWDHLSVGVTKDYLWQEREKAYEQALTGDCRFEKCTVCGVCQDLDVRMLLRKGEDHEGTPKVQQD